MYSLLAVMETDAAFRKTTLENLRFKVVVPGTSKHWSCYTGLLFFCLKFRLLCVEALVSKPVL